MWILMQVKTKCFSILVLWAVDVSCSVELSMKTVFITSAPGFLYMTYMPAQEIKVLVTYKMMLSPLEIFPAFFVVCLTHKA